MVEIIAIITLALLVIAQAVERYFFGKQMTEELSKSIKAVMSRNINEYLTALQADKSASNAPVQEDDEVEMGDASDDEFDKHIKSQTK